jgi:hypothetical protein
MPMSTGPGVIGFRWSPKRGNCGRPVVRPNGQSGAGLPTTGETFSTSMRTQMPGTPWPDRFVTYLLRQYGMQKFSQLYRAVPDAEADAADFEAEFARFYPVSMDQAWQTPRRQANLIRWLSGCLGDWSCWTTGPPLGLGEEVTQDCANGIHRTITVADGQNGVVLLKSGGGTLAVWKTCWDRRRAVPSDQEGSHRSERGSLDRHGP